MPLHPATYGLGSFPPLPDQSKIKDFRCVRPGLDLCEDALCRISSEMRQEKPSGFEFRVVRKDHPVPAEYKEAELPVGIVAIVLYVSAFHETAGNLSDDQHKEPHA